MYISVMRTLSLILTLTIFCFELTSIAQTPIVADPPSGTLDGVNILSGTSVIIQLRAPSKQYVYLKGDFNSFSENETSLMKLSTDGNYHWLQIDGLNPGTYYRYFFLVEGVLEIGDPYSELILDPWHDGFIPQDHFPGMPQYPHDVASVPIGAFRTDNPYFLWTDYDFQKPSQDKLVIYECLVRDFDSGSVNV